MRTDHTSGASSWSVATWNLQGSRPTNINKVAATIKGAGSEIVVLQECSRRQARRIANLLNMNFTWCFKHGLFGQTFFAEGLAVLSFHRITRCTSEVLSANTQPWSWRRRIALIACVERDDDIVNVLNVHLTPPHGVTDSTDRIKEFERTAAALKTFAATSTDSTYICAGDFNSVASDLQPLCELLGASCVTSSATSPAERPVQDLDHVLIPRGGAVHKIHVFHGGRQWRGISDHLPVAADIATPAAASFVD